MPSLNEIGPSAQPQHEPINFEQPLQTQTGQLLAMSPEEEPNDSLGHMEPVQPAQLKEQESSKEESQSGVKPQPEHQDEPQAEQEVVPQPEQDKEENPQSAMPPDHVARPSVSQQLESEFHGAFKRQDSESDDEQCQYQIDM